MNNLNHWIMASRPKTLPAGASPVLLGLALAYHFGHSLNYPLALATLLCTLLLQISSNLINDYYDGIRGLDGAERLGPKRVTALGLIPPKKVRNAFLFTLIMAFLIGLYPMLMAGKPIILTGLLSIFFAWAYTGGPFPLSHYALGEVFAFIFFGLIAVWGTFYIQTQELLPPISIFLGGISLGLLASALMGVNNLRDAQQDSEKGKVTIATIIGNKAMRLLIILFIFLSTGTTLLMLHKALLPNWSLILPIIILISRAKLLKEILLTSKGSQLNNTLADIGKLLFITSLVCSLTLFVLKF